MAHLTKRKKGGNFYVRFKDNLGRDQWISTRRKKLGGEDGANAFFEDWIKNRKKYSTTNIMLSELISEVLKFIKLNLPRSYGNYKECLNKFLIITKDKPVKLVNNQDIEYYKSIRVAVISQRKKPLSVHTINREEGPSNQHSIKPLMS